MCKNWFSRYLFGTAIKRNLLWSKCLHPVVIHPHAQSIFIEFILDSFLPGCKSAFRFLPQLVRFSFQLGWPVNICFAKTGCCLWCNTYKEPPIHQTHLDIILFPKILRKVVSVSLKGNNNEQNELFSPASVPRDFRFRIWLYWSHSKTYVRPTDLESLDIFLSV